MEQEVWSKVQADQISKLPATHHCCKLEVWALEQAAELDTTKWFIREFVILERVVSKQ